MATAAVANGRHASHFENSLEDYDPKDYPDSTVISDLGSVQSLKDRWQSLSHPEQKSVFNKIHSVYKEPTTTPNERKYLASLLKDIKASGWNNARRSTPRSTKDSSTKDYFDTQQTTATASTTKGKYVSKSKSKSGKSVHWGNTYTRSIVPSAEMAQNGWDEFKANENYDLLDAEITQGKIQDVIPGTTDVFTRTLLGRKSRSSRSKKRDPKKQAAIQDKMNTDLDKLIQRIGTRDGLLWAPVCTNKTLQEDFPLLYEYDSFPDEESEDVQRKWLEQDEKRMEERLVRYKDRKGPLSKTGSTKTAQKTMSESEYREYRTQIAVDRRHHQRTICDTKKEISYYYGTEGEIPTAASTMNSRIEKEIKDELKKREDKLAKKKANKVKTEAPMEMNDTKYTELLYDSIYDKAEWDDARITAGDDKTLRTDAWKEYTSSILERETKEITMEEAKRLFPTVMRWDGNLDMMQYQEIKKEELQKAYMEIKKMRQMGLTVIQPSTFFSDSKSGKNTELSIRQQVMKDRAEERQGVRSARGRRMYGYDLASQSTGGRFDETSSSVSRSLRDKETASNSKRGSSIDSRTSSGSRTDTRATTGDSASEDDDDDDDDDDEEF